MSLAELNKAAARRIDARDQAHLDPAERAELVHNFIFSALGIEDEKESITHPLFWDLLCYCSEMFNIYALQMDEEDTLQIAKTLSKYLYSRHYSVPDAHIILGPSRREHTKIWVQRMNKK